MDAAIKVFAEKGYHSATLDEVAQKAEFSKGALYLYFTNKEDLLFSIINDAISQWIELITLLMSGTKRFREELHELFLETARELFKKPDLHVLFSAQLAVLFQALSEERRQEIIGIHNHLWEIISSSTDSAIKNGELRDLPLFAIVGMIHGAIDSMLNGRWGCETFEEIQTAIMYFIDMLFNGIAQEKETNQ